MPLDVLFLGGISVDLIQNREKKKTPSKFTAFTGGSITNSAVIAGKLGIKTALLSRIGKDPLGDLAISFLRKSGVNTSGIIQDPNIRTPLAIANIDKRGNSKYTFYKNPPEKSMVPLKDVPKYLLKGCKFFHFGSSFSYQKETSIEALKYVKLLKKTGTFISFDPNIRPYAIHDKIKAKNRVLELLKWVDLAKLSEIDLEFITGQKNPEKGLKKLKEISKCEVILTLGSKGSAYLKPLSLRVRRSGRSNLIKIPAFKVKIADTIGAGDAFTAGILYKLNKIGKKRFFSNIRPNLIFASAVSALICTKQGAYQGLKDIKQVNSFPCSEAVS